VTAVIPYLAYARKDRQTKSRDPMTTRYVAQLLEATGVDCVVTLEVHNIVAFQNAFRCRRQFTSIPAGCSPIGQET
jgi:ribose-phosphate pyrophosphokinase